MISIEFLYRAVPDYQGDTYGHCPPCISQPSAFFNGDRYQSTAATRNNAGTSPTFGSCYLMRDQREQANDSDYRTKSHASKPKVKPRHRAVIREVCYQVTIFEIRLLVLIAEQCVVTVLCGTLLTNRRTAYAESIPIIKSLVPQTAEQVEL